MHNLLQRVRRTKLLALSASALTVAALAPAAGVASANTPGVFAFGGPQGVAVGGSGFTPGAVLQIQVINPLVPASGGPPQVLNPPEERFLTASPCGQIGQPPNDACGGPPVSVPVPNYSGPVEVLVTQCGATECGSASDPGQVGPIAAVSGTSPDGSTQVRVLPAAQISASAAKNGQLTCQITVTGSGFGSLQQNLRMFMEPPGAPPFSQGFAMAPADNVEVGPTGAIGAISAFSPDFVQAGTTVNIIPSLVGAPVSATLNACGGAGQISAPPAAPTPAPTPPTTSSGGGGGGSTFTGVPHVHAAE